MGRAFMEEIIEMRNQNPPMTYQNIADKLGVSRQSVWLTAKEAGLTNTNYERSKVIYKGVKDWMLKHKMTLHNFCIKCGESYGANSKTYKFLTGRYKGDINTITGILEACGITFFEAFGEVIENEERNRD